MRAIVMDDSRAIRMIIGMSLKQRGFEIFHAENGQEGLDLIEKNGAPELAMVDWNMPVMNGYDFVCNVRSDSKCAHMKIMMVTTENEMSQMTKALEAGADEYLMKPFVDDDLSSKLELLGF